MFTLLGSGLGAGARTPVLKSCVTGSRPAIRPARVKPQAGSKSYRFSVGGPKGLERRWERRVGASLYALQYVRAGHLYLVREVAR